MENEELKSKKRRKIEKPIVTEEKKTNNILLYIIICLLSLIIIIGIVLFTIKFDSILNKNKNEDVKLNYTDTVSVK